MNPATFLRVLGPEPWRVAYDEPSIRPDDSRYGDNPNRLQRHTQFQVIVKPAPADAQELVVGSYKALGIDTVKHDIRFVEDNWESPALGAWGLGWEVWLDGMEVTQFTYFQQAGGMPLDSVAVEITYGLERIIMALQEKTHFRDIVFADGITYGDIFLQNEIEMSKYNMLAADLDRNNIMFETYEAEAKDMIAKKLPVPAYNYLLKASHTFNVLDARGAIGVTERARYFQRMRALSRDCAKLWLKRREEQGFPLMREATSTNVSPGPMPPALETRTADMVLEIGVEELPPGDVAEARAQVLLLFSNVLSAAGLSYSSIDVSGTPRRIATYVKDLQTRQADERNRVRGPPLRAALKDGEPTKAATGFMRSQGVTEADVEFDENEGYMYATVEKKGRDAAEVLAEMVPSAVLGKISFGKSMKWNDTGVSFSRPLRWLVCLLDNHVVPFEFAGVASGRDTRSLRGPNGYPTENPIPSAAEYHHVLKELQILLSREDRASYIRKEAVKLANEIGGTVPEDYLHGDLLDEITNLVESPIPLIGRYDEEFLDLPDEVLVTVMKKHQRYLPVVDASGKLLNAFITVANGDPSLADIDKIRKGNEAVLRARYSDAVFFYELDGNGKKLVEFVPKLAGLTFQEQLGSMLDKTNRVSGVIPRLADMFSLTPEETKTATHAASLYKADLATSMVIELTSLAGVMGRHYSQKSGEATVEVSEAIFEANLPRFSGDQVAKSKAGATVAVADRIDSLVGLFSVGLVPKSTADPFALRRAALGAVQTLVENNISVDISDLVQASASTIAEQTGKGVSHSVQDSVVEFVVKRLESYLLDVLHIRDDIVKAVLAVPRNGRNPLAAIQLCRAMQDFVETNSEVLSQAQEAHSRAARLLKSVKDVSTEELLKTPIAENLFEGDEERLLWNALQEVSQNEGDYDAMVTSKVHDLVRIKPVVDCFFDGVFVNAEDQAVKRNRLALCSRIAGIMGSDVDLAFLQV